MINLAIPKTTPEEPYIEFMFNEKGKLISLQPTGTWYGGLVGGFHTSYGDAGNSCKPKDLKLYIDRFKSRKVREIEKEISKLQKQLEALKKA
jgi:hypothetical protein